jgi:hypothetical protein
MQQKGKSSVATQLTFSFTGNGCMFQINESIIRPVYKTNSRYYVKTCHYIYLSFVANAAEKE